MSEDVFLLLYGALFGIPLLLGCGGFLLAMIQHDREMKESMNEIDKIKARREENEINA